eukprot:3217476-Rhodomonas_salina.1
MKKTTEKDLSPAEATALSTLLVSLCPYAYATAKSVLGFGGYGEGGRVETGDSLGGRERRRRVVR